MKNLTKTQWTTFIITAVTMAFALFADQGGILGLGTKGVAIVGFLKTIWDLYLSFNVDNMHDYAEYSSKNQTSAQRLSSSKTSIENWKKYRKA